MLPDCGEFGFEAMLVCLAREKHDRHGIGAMRKLQTRIKLKLDLLRDYRCIIPSKNYCTRRSTSFRADLQASYFPAILPRLDSGSSKFYSYFKDSGTAGVS